MVTLTLRDEKKVPISLNVPDFPYTRPFTHSGSVRRIAVSPCEFDGAGSAIATFLAYCATSILDNGAEKLIISHDEDGILETWQDVLIVPFFTSYGIGVEFEALTPEARRIQSYYSEVRKKDECNS